MSITFRPNEKSKPVLQNEKILEKYNGKASKLINDAIAEFGRNHAPPEHEPVESPRAKVKITI